MLLALQTLFPQYKIIPLNRTQYTILLVCSLVAWAIWVIWLLDQHRKKGKLPEALSREPAKQLAKPQLYSISLAQEPEIIRMREIRVRLDPNNERKQRAWFYIVSLGVPLGAESAREVQPLFKFPTTNDVYQLRFIPTSGKPWIHVTWPLPPEAPDFDKEQDGFAKALVLDKNRRIEKLSLEEGQHLKPFIFLFTVHGSDTLYFPTPNLICFKMPTRFRTALYLQAADRPPIIAKTFEIDARSWESVSVNEVRDSP